jgi:hypothetical protein
MKHIPNRDFYLYAPVTREGWFNLDTLNDFCAKQLDSTLESGVLQSDPNLTLILDFKAVRKWDISALLWLSIALKYYYREAGLKFKLRLPEPDNFMNEFQHNDAIKSSEYLRRWSFDKALKHVDSLDRLLIESQRDYFSNTEFHFYKEASTFYTLEGKTYKPESNSLIKVRDLSTFGEELGNQTISDLKIEQCIKDFHDPNVANVLHSQCGLPQSDATAFADHLVGESLLNVKQHPGATSGFLAISKLKDEGELILAIVDDGNSIQETIEKVYKDKNKSVAEKTLNELSWEVRADILDFATEPHVSSKDLSISAECGMGLTYIKEDAVDKFKGKFTIIGQSALVEYKGDSQATPSKREWKHPWKGNLLRISIPIAGRDSAGNAPSPIN